MKYPGRSRRLFFSVLFLFTIGILHTHAQVPPAENGGKEKKSFIVRTNPFEDIIITAVQADDETPVKAELMDLTGKKIATATITAGRGTSVLAMEGLARLSKGIYILRIQAGPVTESFKVVKQ